MKLKAEEEEEVKKKSRRLLHRRPAENKMFWGNLDKENHLLSFEDFRAAVADVEEAWKDKQRLFGGKAQKFFHSFCKTLDAHSNFLKMIPNQNEYCSIFCASITTLIKVCYRYAFNWFSSVIDHNI